MGELKARGVEDVLVVVCDGLTGLPQAVTSVWPQWSDPGFPDT
jgi:putative transposase